MDQIAGKLKFIDVRVQWPGQEEAALQLSLGEDGQIQEAKISGIGGEQFLQALKKLRMHLKGKVADLDWPAGTSVTDIFFRELISKAKGEWNYPYNDDELCHCRSVARVTVDMAVCMGAHTPQQVSEKTSASTACGTCRPNVEEIIKYRLHKTRG